MELKENKKKRIGFVVASPMTAEAFLVEQLRELSKLYDVSLISSFKGDLDRKKLPSSIKCIDINIERNVSFFSDLKSLYKLARHFASGHYSLIHSVTPKAGLLSMIAAKLIGVKARVHTFTGQVWASKSGISRSILKLLDKVIGYCCTNALVDSSSQRQFLLDNKVISPKKSLVLADGSISGVNLSRFKPSNESYENLRDKYRVTKGELVLLFLGRLKKDKGVNELVEAYKNLAVQHSDLHLWVVGPDEESMTAHLNDMISQFSDRVKFVSFTEKPENYMQAADVFCLPSYREGFGSVIIEAAACGIPSIGSDIYGVQDAIDDGVTGLLVPAKDSNGLQDAISRLLDDDELRASMGRAALGRAQKLFSSQRLSDALCEYYREIFDSHAETLY